MVSILVVSAAGNVSIENHFLVVLLGGSHRAVVVVIRAVVSSLPNSPDSKTLRCRSSWSWGAESWQVLVTACQFPAALPAFVEWVQFGSQTVVSQ